MSVKNRNIIQKTVSFTFQQLMWWKIWQNGLKEEMVGTPKTSLQFSL